MKKYSWIFALIMALTMAFVFTACPGDDPEDETKKDDGTQAGGGSSITFGTGNGQTQVYEKDTPTGTITYANGGYTYTYGTGTASSYGGSILRFKVNLGDETLGEKYQGVQFSWQANGYADDDSVANNKKIFLLATDSEANITPPQDAVDGVDNKRIKDAVVSTNYYDTHTDGFWNVTDYTNVTGNEPKVITLPIVKGSYLMGEIWFAVYVHAVKDSYTIKNFKFLETYDGGVDIQGDNATPAPARPAPPAPPGAAPFNFSLDLSDWDTQGVSLPWSGNAGAPQAPNAAVVPDGNYADGKLTVEFTLQGQRINIALTEEQTAALENRSGKKVSFDIQGSVVSGSGEIRYFIGTASEGGSWNATSGSGNGAFDAKLATNQEFNNNADSEGRLGYFILQYMSEGTLKIEIESIRIYTSPFEVDLSTAENSLTTDDLPTQYAGYAVLFPAIEDFDIKNYTKITIEVEYKKEDGTVVPADWFGMVKIGPATNGQDGGLWDSTKYLEMYNLGNSTSNVALSADAKTALAALATDGWGVRLIKSDKITAFSTITLTGIKFHN